MLDNNFAIRGGGVCQWKGPLHDSPASGRRGKAPPGPLYGSPGRGRGGKTEMSEGRWGKTVPGLGKADRWAGKEHVDF